MGNDGTSTDEGTDGELGDFTEWEDETEEWRNEIDRKRGILTRGDREFLRGEKTLEGQAARNANHRIKNRLTSAIRDIILLTDTDELYRVGQIIEELEHPRQKGLASLSSVKFGIEAAMAYSDIDPFGRGNTKEEELESVLESAIEEVIRSRPDNQLPENVSISLDLDAVEYDPDEVIDELLYGKLTSPEVVDLLQMADAEELRRRMEEEDEEIEVYSPDPVHSDKKVYSITVGNLGEWDGEDSE